MTISRRQRKVEENKLRSANSKRRANKNLKKNVTVLGAGLFFGGVVAQTGSVIASHKVFADAFTNNNSSNTDAVNDPTTDTGTGMFTPRGVGDQNFIDYIGNSARKLAGNNDIYASVMIAQAMIESGWGTSGLASAPNYNLFGIKGAYQGTAVNMPTQEDDGTGNLFSINSDFKKYPSYKESLEDYVSLIRGGVSGNPQMYAGTWKSNTDSYKDATEYLTGKYATDTTYADKLNNIIEKYNLTRFDQSDDSSRDESYVFAQGDTLQSVADKFNVTLDTLMDLNGLQTSSYVYPGKTLIVNKVIGNSPVPVSNVSTLLDKSAGDLYGNQQAPVIVQDETDGVKEYDPSDSDANSTKAVSVSDDTVGNKSGATAVNVSSNSSTQSASNPSTVSVQAGDTLDSIASQAGTSIEQLKEKNNLNSDLLVVGQQLLV
ncbi:glucosaminidase domain-containing protein [Companilactobacillus mishanensis]|uniref:Peptidoglycan hydrolase n=1 Tax=Companilactobacillus mishanensis TaxID=2486008 RepID=A0A5P0ZKG4_9LACO|nr:glucosaminidase domain-containing protein [Companilactobacillus mishanensis]MQS53475.1 LysM peptidoglycan-binding domain-containing protein [Companilactobacillus mishanensis]